MSEYMPEDMSDRMPEDMSEYMPEDMPDRMPDWMPEDMSDRVPEDMPDRMPEDLPDRMPEDMPEDMPDHMPEDMPDRMPNRMSEDMSDRMPEDLPVRKCINVMVWITRSKVIFYGWRVQIYHLSSHILISKPWITKKWDFLVRPQGSDGSPVVLKPHLQSVLINVARGGVCDQPALAELLSQRRFRAGRAAWVVHVAPSWGFSPGNLLDQRHLDSLGLICSGFCVNCW